MTTERHEREQALNPVVTTGELLRYNPWEGISVTPISGDEHGLDGFSIILAETEPGGEIPVHSHPYQEAFIVKEGRGRWTVGEIEYDAGVGDIVVAPAGTPHKFVNVGSEIMRHTSIQLTGTLPAAFDRNPITGIVGADSEIDG